MDTIKRYSVLALLSLLFLSQPPILGTPAGQSKQRQAKQEKNKKPARKQDAKTQNGKSQKQNGVAQADSREELWREKRLEKLENIRPPRAHPFESFLLWIDKSLLVAGPKEPSFFPSRTPLWERKPGLWAIPAAQYGGLSPLFGTIISGSGLSTGFQYRQTDIGGTGLDLASRGAFSYRGYEMYDLQFGDTRERRNGFFMFADLRYRDLPREDFYGVGPDSVASNRSDFRLNDRFFGGTVGYRFTPWLRAAARAGYLDVNLGRGTDDRFPDVEDRFSERTAPGLSRHPDFLQLHSALFIDYRDVPGNPHNGGVIGLSFSRFDDRGGQEFEFNRFALEARQFIPLFSPQRVLALRFYTSKSEPDSNGRVPFFLQETLGGSSLLRGFDTFRFRDENLLYVSAEYRFEPALWLELAAFYDAGKVFPNWSDFNFSGLRTVWGGGIRLKSEESVILRLDVGRSNEEVKFTFKLGPSF